MRRALCILRETIFYGNSNTHEYIIIAGRILYQRFTHLDYKYVRALYVTKVSLEWFGLDFNRILFLATPVH